MANLNKVMLIGNLTRDPELRYTPKGTAVADIAIAINRVWNDEGGNKQEEVTFVDVTLWGRQAELAQQYLSKGRGAYIEGRLQMDTWDDKQTGQKRSKLKVVAESLQFLPDGKGGGERSGGGEPRQQGNARGNSAPPQQRNDAPEDYGDDDDIPF